MRKCKLERKTLETNISLELNIDGSGKSQINTGIGFLDHMLTLLAFHSDFDLKIQCEGDLHVDGHHTAEDIGIVLGQAFSNIIGDKKGIKRYASIFVPMDEALCRTALDISGRPYLVFEVDFMRETIGTMDVQNFKEFFRAFVNNSKITLHTSVLYGENDHHKIESVFKSVGRVLKEAVLVTSNKVSSSKGVL